MPEIHASLAALLDRAVGRADAATIAHTRQCARCGDRAAHVADIVSLGRAAVAEAGPTRKQIRRSMKQFRAAQEHWAAPILRLVVDSFLRPAPALRSSAPEALRYVRYTGVVSVELQITPSPRGATVHGCVEPSDDVDEVVAVAGGHEHRARIEEDGSFVLRRLPHRETELRFGAARIVDLKL